MEITKQNLINFLPEGILIEDFAAILWDNLDIGVALVDHQGHWVYANPRLCDIIGYSLLELKDLSFQDVTVEEDLYYDLNLAEAIKNNNISCYTLYKHYRHKLGHQIPIRLKVIPIGEGRNEMTLFLSQVTHLDKETGHEKLNEAILTEVKKASSSTCSVVSITLLVIILIIQLITLG